MHREHTNRRGRAAAQSRYCCWVDCCSRRAEEAARKAPPARRPRARGASGRGGFAARAAALRTCLKKEGITLPERKPPSTTGGQPRGPFGSGAPRGGFQLPKGVTREQMQAALKKCGAGSAGLHRFSGGRNPQRLAKFASCMRSNGVNLPSPNTSGKGPVFDTKGIDTTSSTFKQADAKCAKELQPSGPPPGAPG